MRPRAQWLVQDEKLYKLVKEGIVDKIATSGKGEGSFKKNGTVKDDSNEFHALTLTTKELLAKDKEDRYDEKGNIIEKKTNGYFVGANGEGSVKGDKSASGSGSGFFYEKSIPSCNKSTVEIYTQCMHMRNILGAQLKEIQNISKNLEARNRALQDIMTKNQFKTTGELQKRQYEMSVLQTVIANDQMRLQTALASYQAMRDLYKEQYNEALQARNSGGLGNAVKKLRGAGAATAAFAATKAAVDSAWGAEIFKERRTVDQVIRQRR